MASEALRSFLAESRARLVATVQVAAPELLTRRPAPERWSPLEVLEHVALVERWFVQIVAGLAEEGARQGLRFQEGTTRATDSIAAMATQVDIHKPMQAAEFVHPTGEASLPELLEQLSRSRQDLLGLLPALDELDTNRLQFRHPTQHFLLNAYEWVHLSGVHDRLHARQIRQALESAS